VTASSLLAIGGGPCAELSTNAPAPFLGTGYGI